MHMMTGIDAIDGTVHKSLVWVDEVAAELGTDRHRAYRAIAAVLHVLRDRLGPNEAADLAAQLPLLIRGLYYEGWTPKGKPSRIRHFDELIEAVRARLEPGASVPHACAVVEAVWRTLDRHISPGELDDVRGCLPRNVREIWAG